MKILADSGIARLWNNIKTHLNNTYVPQTRTVNNKNLTADTTIEATDIQTSATDTDTVKEKIIEALKDLCVVYPEDIFSSLLKAKDEEDGSIAFSHNPFSMPQGGMDALMNKNPTDILAYQYDLVCNGIELASGAVRNHNPEIMKKAFDIAGYTEEELAKRFGAMYTAFQYGAPPHAGMAPGVDRIIMLLADEETIRDVIAFPLNSAAQDLMLGAPSEVSELQLLEANISIRED